MLLHHRIDETLRLFGVANVGGMEAYAGGKISRFVAAADFNLATGLRQGGSNDAPEAAGPARDDGYASSEIDGELARQRLFSQTLAFATKRHMIKQIR